MFQLVEYSQLKVNEKYKIVSVYEYTGRFKETIHLSLDKPFSIVKFDALYNVTSNKKSWFMEFCNEDTYYKFVSENPKEKMERRAVNIILRRLLGDNCFEW